MMESSIFIICGFFLWFLSDIIKMVFYILPVFGKEKGDEEELWAVTVLREKWGCKVSMDKEEFLLMSCFLCYEDVCKVKQNKVIVMGFVDPGGATLFWDGQCKNLFLLSWWGLLLSPEERVNRSTTPLSIYISAVCLTRLMGFQTRHMWFISARELLLLNSHLKCKV